MLAHHFHFDQNLIAGHDLPTKPYMLKRRQDEEEFLHGAIDIEPVVDRAMNEQPTSLRHRLAKKHPRHDRSIRKVPTELRFVAGNILESHEALAHFYLDHPINQEEGVFVGKQFDRQMFAARQGPALTYPLLASYALIT
jgi:hypothetical protein